MSDEPQSGRAPLSVPLMFAFCFVAVFAPNGTDIPTVAFLLACACALYTLAHPWWRSGAWLFGPRRNGR